MARAARGRDPRAARAWRDPSRPHTHTLAQVDYCGEKHIFVNSEEVLGVFDGGKVSIDTFRPLSDRLLIATAEAATETTTGIALAGLEDDEEDQGEVVKVGEGRTTSMGELAKPSVAVGDSVMYKPRSGLQATIEDKRFIIVFETDCIAKW